MDTNKTFGILPETTINPSKFGAQAAAWQDSLYRPFQWLTPPMNENMQQPENDHSMITLLDLLGPKERQTNPTVRWKIENRLNNFTYVNKAVSAADVYISVAESVLAQVGWKLLFPKTGQQMLVVDIDPDLSEGWTNDNSDACNVKVSRSILPGPQIIAPINSEVRPGLPQLGELGEPKLGITTVPGDAVYNFIKLSAMKIEMSLMQRESLMAGDYGTHEHLIMTNEHLMAEMLQTDILLGRRGNRSDASEGQVYEGNGLIPQIQSNVLSAGSVGNSLPFATLSDFIDGTFESANTSATKHIASGELAYLNYLNQARQEAHITEETHYDPALGVDTFNMTTGGGKTVTVAKHRFALQGELADTSLILDLGNIRCAEYAEFEGWKWAFDLEAPLQGITKKTDAIVGSSMVAVIDPDTCGVAKGQVIPRTKNRNGLGVVYDIANV